MKKVIIYATLVSLVVFYLTSCAVMGPFGAYVDVKMPSTRLHAPLDNGAKWTKVGTAKYQIILGIVAIGDGSIEAAMRDGNINKIHHVDTQIKNILNLYSEVITIVYGE